MTKEQFERAKRCGDKGVLVHLVCNEADERFYSDDPDAMTPHHCAVLCVETFFSAVCEGGMAAWFDQDCGQLAHRCPDSLRKVGLTEYAKLAEDTLSLHCKQALPTSVFAWGEHLSCIRGQHGDGDPCELYEEMDVRFFDLFQRNPREFRDRLYDYIIAHEADFLAASQQTAGGV